MSARQARVTVAYATVTVLDTATGKPTVQGFYQDSVFPPSADPAGVARLVRRGYAEWVEEPEAPPTAEAPVDEKPVARKAAAKSAD